MTISKIMQKMIAFSDGNRHDINHLLKVWGYAKTIGDAEKLDADTQFLLETAAITHDIACPLCREKYGNTNGKYQEAEGAVLVRGFLADTGLTEKQIDRVSYLVGHQAVSGADYQILIEADYLVNADESSYSAENIRNFRDKFFKTETGTRLLNAIYRV